MKKRIGIVSFKYEANEFTKKPIKDKEYKEEKWSNVESTAKKFNDRRLSEMSEIRDYYENNGVDHLLFPGKTLAVTNKLWDDGSIEQMLKEITRIYQGIPFILEAMYSDSSEDQEIAPVDTGIICFDKACEVGERIQQVFTSSDLSPVPYGKIKYKRFWAENLWGHRIKNIDGINYLIWVCGEINFLSSPDHGKKKPIPRVDFGNVKKELNNLSFDIFFNPSHTPMGEVHILKNKLGYLSNLGKVAIHTTNLPRFQESTNSSLYCFMNGQEVEYKQKMDWPQDKSWNMEIVEVNI